MATVVPATVGFSVKEATPVKTAGPVTFSPVEKGNSLGAFPSSVPSLFFTNTSPVAVVAVGSIKIELAAIKAAGV